MAAEDIEAQGTGQVGDDGVDGGLHSGGHAGHGRIGRGDHEEVDPVGSACQVVAPPQRILDPPPGGGQRTAERESGPARADDA